MVLSCLETESSQIIIYSQNILYTQQNICLKQYMNCAFVLPTSHDLRYRLKSNHCHCRANIYIIAKTAQNTKSERHGWILSLNMHYLIKGINYDVVM